MAMETDSCKADVNSGIPATQASSGRARTHSLAQKPGLQAAGVVTLGLCRGLERQVSEWFVDRR